MEQTVTYPPFYNGQLDGIPSSNPLSIFWFEIPSSYPYFLGKPIQSISPEKTGRTGLFLRQSLKLIFSLDKSQTGKPEPADLRQSQGSTSASPS